MRQPVKSKQFPDSADNFCLNKNFHHTIFGLDVSKTIPNLPTCADRPLHCKWAFKKIEAFKKILYPPIEQCSNTTPHWRFGDIYRRPGLLTITWVNWKFGWKIKWFVPFYLGSVRNLQAVILGHAISILFLVSSADLDILCGLFFHKIST